jgi:hypothetical protein
VYNLDNIIKLNKDIDSLKRKNKATEKELTDFKQEYYKMEVAINHETVTNKNVMVYI